MKTESQRRLSDSPFCGELGGEPDRNPAPLKRPIAPIGSRALQRRGVSMRLAAQLATKRRVTQPPLRITIFAALICSVLSILTAAATAGPQTILDVPYVSQPPGLEQFRSMGPDQTAPGLTEVTGFIQQVPSDGAPATQETRVFLGYDSKNLYLVWVCGDSQPAGVRAHMSRRERIYEDDYVEVTLDTFKDQRHAFVFASNPLGIQEDGLWTEGNTEADNTWDTLWHSRGELTPHGFLIWQAIPFRSLRFTDTPVKSWGLVLRRHIARADEQVYWPRVSSRIAGRLNQEAVLRGLEKARPGHNVQFIPYTTTRGYRSLDTRDATNPRFSTRRAEVQGGLDSKFVFQNSLVFDLAVNPDFSQVESDEPQNTVNQRFEVFFPEKRPFFMENSNYFASGPLTQLVFTRRIADPQFGAKLTGKRGPWTIAMLAADDASPGEAVTDHDPLRGKRAYFGVLRVARDIGTQSSVGAIYTDREFEGRFNRVAGVDANLRLGSNWTSNLRSAVSATSEADPGAKNASWGAAYEATLTGNGRRFSYIGQYQDIGPRFQTHTGFLTRNDIRRIYQYFHFYFRPEGKHLVHWGPEVSAERVYDHTGLAIGYKAAANLVFGLKRSSYFAQIAGVQSDTLRPQDFPGLSENHTFSGGFAGFVFGSTPADWLSLRTLFVRSDTMNLVVSQGQAPNKAEDTLITQALTIRPSERLQIDGSYLLDRVIHDRIGRAVFNNHIFRAKTNVQLNRELSFRVIAQYNGLLANQGYSVLQTTKNLNLDFLVTYLLHPGTAVYLGYNSNLQNLAPDLCLRAPGMTECDPSTAGPARTSGPFINDGRIFFVKVSYLFRP